MPDDTGFVTPERVFAVGRGFAQAKAVFTAIDTGLFAALGEPATVPDLAKRLDLPPRSTRMLCQTLTVAGLLERDGDTFRNAPDTEAFLAGRGPVDLRPTLRYWDQVSYPGWTEAQRAYTTGRPVFPPMTAAQTEAYEAGVAALTEAAAQALTDAYDFTVHRRVLDIGGGLGTFLRPILRAVPHLTGVLLDLPAVAGLAAGKLAGAAEADRIEVVGADALADPLPSGCDGIVVANLLHLLPEADNLRLLARLREVAPDGGRLLLVDWWRDPDDPHLDTISAASEFLMISGGDTYEVAEARGWLSRTGWRPVEHRDVLPPTGVIIAEAV